MKVWNLINGFTGKFSVYVIAFLGGYWYVWAQNSENFITNLLVDINAFYLIIASIIAGVAGLIFCIKDSCINIITATLIGIVTGIIAPFIGFLLIAVIFVGLLNRR